MKLIKGSICTDKYAFPDLISYYIYRLKSNGLLLLFQLAVTLGQETINTPLYTQIDAAHCHLMTEQLQRYALIGEPVAQGRAVKILRLAAFAPSLPPSVEFSIRVYVVEDTPDALEVGCL